MKRIWILLACVVVVAILVAVFLGLQGSSPTTPRFIPGPPAFVPAYVWDHYDWGGDATFEGGKMWLWTAAKTNFHVYLYDLEQRKILGELKNAAMPKLSRPDGSRFMCEGPAERVFSPKQLVFDLVRKISGGKIKPGNRSEAFWVVDVRSNSAVRIGSVSQFQGSGSGWRRSPSGRYGYTRPTGGMGKSIFLCDLDTASGRNISIHGESKGWWSDREILIATGTNSFDLLDVETQTNRTLFSADYIKSFLSGADMNPSARLDAFANWNGREYDFYFGEKDLISGLSGKNSFLLKADKSGPTLKVLYPDFKFQWGGHLDNTGTHYLYQGEPGAPGKSGNGAVYLRNLTNGTTTTVIPPDNKGQYAIPRLYGDEVIYFRNRLMYRVRLDGSNDVRLLDVGAK